MIRRLLILLADLADTPANRSVRELVSWCTGQGAPPEIEVVAGQAGPLLAGFTQIAETFVVNEGRPVRLSGRLQHVGLHRPAEIVRSQELRRRIGGRQDVVWLTDLRAAHLLHWTGPAARMVAHHHASAPPLDPMKTDGLLLRSRVDAVVAGSKTAAVAMSTLFPEGEAVVHPDLERTARLGTTRPPERRQERRAETRLALEGAASIPSDVPLMVGAGPVDFWHASNTFAQACWDIRMARPEIDTHFAWLAEGSTERMLWPLRHDLAHAGLSHVVHVLQGEVAPLEVLVAADVHLRTGRHPIDPFEVSELANAGAPIVGFESASFPDRLRAHARLVGWLDVHAMRDAALSLALDPIARAAQGEPPNDDPCRWDVRVGGPSLLATLLGTHS